MQSFVGKLTHAYFPNAYSRWNGRVENSEQVQTSKVSAPTSLLLCDVTAAPRRPRATQHRGAACSTRRQSLLWPGPGRTTTPCSASARTAPRTSSRRHTGRRQFDGIRTRTRTTALLLRRSSRRLRPLMKCARPDPPAPLADQGGALWQVLSDPNKKEVYDRFGAHHPTHAHTICAHARTRLRWRRARSCG